MNLFDLTTWFHDYIYLRLRVAVKLWSSEAANWCGIICWRPVVPAIVASFSSRFWRTVSRFSFLGPRDSARLPVVLLHTPLNHPISTQYFAYHVCAWWNLTFSLLLFQFVPKIVQKMFYLLHLQRTSVPYTEVKKNIEESIITEPYFVQG